ncbi:MAG: DUF47 domain-containing protein [Rhodocyclaceae bacterium]
MFGRLMPREGKFFDLFNAHSEQIVAGAQELVALLDDLGKPDGDAAGHAAAIDVFETRADKITHETIALLHRTFITPLDRDEIHQLITCLDDVLDLIQDVAHSIRLYDVRRVTEQARQLADICLSCCERVRSAAGLLHDMDHAAAILKTCREIDQLESDADRVMRAALSKLFRDENDMRELIKLKAVYEILEAITDRCEDAANVIEGIVLENS